MLRMDGSDGTTTGSTDGERLEEAAVRLQKWARTKRREAADFVGPEKEQARWIAKGYDSAADLLISLIPSVPQPRADR